jgi:hypothetical protein
MSSRLEFERNETATGLIEEIKKLSLKIMKKWELSYYSLMWKLINIQRNISCLRQKH